MHYCIMLQYICSYVCSFSHKNLYQYVPTTIIIHMYVANIVYVYVRRLYVYIIIFHIIDATIIAAIVGGIVAIFLRIKFLLQNYHLQAGN